MNRTPWIRFSRLFLNRNTSKSNYNVYRWTTVLTSAVSAGVILAYNGVEVGHNYLIGETDNERYQVRKDHKLTKREVKFLQFASVDYDDVTYMTPMDFIDSLILDLPRERVYRRVLTEKEVTKMLSRTPPLRKGSKHLFRSLDQKGLISYAEYIFLLTLLTKPKSAFQIAFSLFDEDDNGTIDRDEFIQVRNLINNLRSTTRGPSKTEEAVDESCQLETNDYQFIRSKIGVDRLLPSSDSPEYRFEKSDEEVKKQNTTILMHLFGTRGIDIISFPEFQSFYENLQEELMEIEFYEFARGKNHITPVDFTRLVLRYTLISKEEYYKYLHRVKERSDNDEIGITLEQWAKFSRFLNNLSEFTSAVKLYVHSNVPVSEEEFARAVSCTIGQELDKKVVSLVFRIFDENMDGTLSYPEFLKVMNDRLHRGLKGRVDKRWTYGKFRNCVMKEFSS